MCGTCHRGSRSLAGLVLLALGALLFLDSGVWWTLFILVPGLLLLLPAWYSGAVGAAIFAIPGMLVLGTGALLAVMGFTGLWHSWAYAWTLYGAFLGLAFMLVGLRLPDPSLYNVGGWFVRISLIACVILAFFFEVVLGIGGLSVPGGPLLFIILGLALLFYSRAGRAMFEPPAAWTEPEKAKRKRDDDVPFRGPIVYGTRVRSHGGEELTYLDREQPQKRK
ncbi:MAG: hypothetical protein KatS3mg051_1751 [Anaerolineae bacterium]|nr:MAG: hypothetical protein KatS3mg051_1751 [Anaerolineae bacterium]